VNILKRLATQLLGLLSTSTIKNRCKVPRFTAGRWGFETTSKLNAEPDFLNAASAPDSLSTNFFKLN
jgi:hypothetical protein